MFTSSLLDIHRMLMPLELSLLFELTLPKATQLNQDLCKADLKGSGHNLLTYGAFLIAFCCFSSDYLNFFFMWPSIPSGNVASIFYLLSCTSFCDEKTKICP